MFPLKVYYACSISLVRGAAYGYLGINLIDLSLKFQKDQSEYSDLEQECQHQISWVIGLAIIMLFGSITNIFTAGVMAKLFDMQDYIPYRFQKLINHSDFCFSVVVLVFSFFMLVGYDENCGRFSVLVHFYLLFFWIPISFFASLIGIYIIFKCDYGPIFYELQYATEQELTTTFGQWSTI
ncbi:cation channel family protein (macronuclear) [Tetrahymena thermophila SB210]|uniref:Cation channel family protein n=1 Tax=Tetrahymena thermophila (strain SB210) TaxID=312017 RepID=W7XLG3_TETTS|nr:cation channel family protein [Tetrahymena thermophila SB210]EWS76239.1 cation channel family protein [Tetrahymena thermophila SB210]|eukprot:XP_012651286.1 cation channel family protein [Tetrahymena thermophila SB210]